MIFGRPPEPDGTDRWATIRPIAAYYALAICISWLCWVPLVLSRTGLGWLPFSLPMPWVIPGTAGPLVAAIIVQWRQCGNLAVGRVLVPLRRALLGGLAAVLLLACSFVFGTALLLTPNPPAGWDIAAFGLYTSHLVATFAAGPIFEEWGWRGFAQTRLQTRISPAVAAVIVGVGQGLWHLPLFLIPTWTSASPLSYVTMVAALSVVMAWGFNLSGRSIVVAIVLHAVFNASSRVLGAFLGTARIRSWPDGVTAILLALATTALVLVIVTRGRLGASQNCES